MGSGEAGGGGIAPPQAMNAPNALEATGFTSAAKAATDRGRRRGQHGTQRAARIRTSLNVWVTSPADRMGIGSRAAPTARRRARLEGGRRQGRGIVLETDGA